MKSNGSIINTKELADLAKLSFSDEELCDFERDMEKIVSFAKKVCEAEPCNSVYTVKKKNVLRGDIPSCRIKREKLLSVAPRGTTLDGYFTVPRVVE